MPQPAFEKRLRDRYLTLVQSHLRPNHRLACGVAVPPEAASPLAATQAAYRFFHNEAADMRRLAEPLLKVAREAIPATCTQRVLVVHDWSPVPYRRHARKADRLAMSVDYDLGYKLQMALAVSDVDGSPLAPLALQLAAAEGVHSSLGGPPQPAAAPLDQIEPVMDLVERQRFASPAIHLIDAEANSVFHLRRWSESGRSFLVRSGPTRWVEHEGQELRIGQWSEELQRRGGFRFAREVEFRGQSARQEVAELPVRLLRPAYLNRGGKRRVVRGEPLSLRLVISRVYDNTSGQLVASWFLLSNAEPEIDAPTIALWYYWRWRIESCFKLLKSAGLHLEDWRQQDAETIARRLLVASMACVVVWSLQRNQDPGAEPTRGLLVKLSGRSMPRGKTHTAPALLAGLWNLLTTLYAIEQHSHEELRQLAACTLPKGIPP